MEANRAVVVAVASAATGTVILAGICFWFFYRFMMARQRRKNMLGSSFRREDSESVTLQEFRGAGAVKGVIVDDNGLDFIYLRRLDNGQVTSCFSKIWVNPMLSPPKRIAKPPAVPARTKPSAPPPLPESLKPPGEKASNHGKEQASTEGNTTQNCEIQVKLKPLHWDKVITNADHSLVWNDINTGSFRFDDKLMEALFGYNGADSQKSPQGTSSGGSKPPPSQIFILDPRKSQNTAIVIKSLAISREEILDALHEGKGLCADTLEKLTKICPTEEETVKILQFHGNPSKLADAESFLYHILKAVPSAFTRFNAMLFRSNYDPEILGLKETLQTLELACKELRSRGVFLKLLEAILKAGNRMNEGTARGNAQGFNLNSLRKLSYVKSNDGKTTLLHFVIEQVIRSEGERCCTNQKITVSGHDQTGNNTEEQNSSRDWEYLALGLPALKSLSTEFLNVKKAAAIDYNTFMTTCSTIAVRVNDICELLTHCRDGERTEFMQVMKQFVEESNEELKVVREEQRRVMELVKRTTEYYQAGSSKDKEMQSPLQLFIIVKDFLETVDTVCVDITKKLQRKKVTGAESSPPLSPRLGTPMMFKNLDAFFTPNNQGTLSCESDDDFR
nr:formin-like protein 4 [Ipomoea batatas]